MAGTATSSGTSGLFNYLDGTTEPSLYRNAKVLTRRDLDGSDGGTVGVEAKAYQVDVLDARQFTGANRKTCELNGFEILDAPLEDESLDFFDHNQVVVRYYRECEQFVAGATGGQAFAFDHNLRSAQGKNANTRISGGQTVQGPARMVHGDYTLFSAPQRLRDLTNPPKANDTFRTALLPGQALIPFVMAQQALAEGGRFAIINVWRSIAEQPVELNPLAMCDGQTVNPEDLVVFEIHYQDRIGENYFARHEDAHRFYYYPHMTRSEPMLLKQWDSLGALALTDGKASDASIDAGPCTFSFHSAFDDVAVRDDAPDRLSIEVRCLVIYP
jgi:hypothetical protein